VNLYRELVLVTARIFEPGQQLSCVELVALDTKFWLLSEGQDLWDVIEQVQGTNDYTFLRRAIHLTVEPLPNPVFPYPDWKSYVHMLLSEATTCTEQQFFEVDTSQWNDVIERRLLDSRARIIQFYAVYRVDETVQRDDEDCKDTRLIIEYEGELDLTIPPLTTSALEIQILRVVNAFSHSPFTAGEIDRALVTRPGMALHSALTKLSEQGLLKHLGGFGYETKFEKGAQ